MIVCERINIKKCTQIFLVAFITMFLIVLPNILQNHGLFLYTGDYAVQQIPFYYHAADYVKEYKSGWDWYTDLGSDFLTSYSYYLTGSVFFWLISWLQGSVIIYVMPVMIAFKTAAGALGAYLYIRLYVKNDNASFIGAFLLLKRQGKKSYQDPQYIHYNRGERRYFQIPDPLLLRYITERGQQGNYPLRPE